MNVTINALDGRTFVSIEGRIDTNTADQFLSEIQPLMEGEKPDIEADCSRLDYISSQGLRNFLILQKSVGARGGRLVLSNLQPNVREVFDITGFSNIITIV